MARRARLIESLYRNGHLKLEYESTLTRNAAEAFEARAGNCLSLVIMTAAFARELGLQVRYQSAYLEEIWSRKGSLLLKSGHVNITLGRRLADHGVNPLPYSLTIDFLPQDESAQPEDDRDPGVAGRRDVHEQPVGRGAGAGAARRRVRLGARGGPRRSFVSRRAEHTRRRLSAPRRARARRAPCSSTCWRPNRRTPARSRTWPKSRIAPAATSEAARLRARLAQVEPEPPLHFFNLGMTAMQSEDFRAARDHFAKEAARGEATADVHFWLGVAHYRLGDIERAARELSRAAEASASRTERDLYSAKLDWLRAHHAR